MTTTEDGQNPSLPSQLAEHQAIRQRLRTTWNVFFAKFGRLRDVQLQVIPAIMTGADVLVTAPTAGGKTEAVMAPVCELIKSGRMNGLSCLYVTPTRALVNDLFARLDPQLNQLGLRLGRQTGDHSQPKDTNVLITTPESLESMLTFRKQLLSNVRVVVMDEIHLLDGTARGDQLRLLLRRLQKYLAWVDPENKVTRIAISATVSDPQRIADVYLDNQAKIVRVVGQRPIQCEYISTEDGQDVVDCIVKGMNSFTDVTKVLVFANRRRDVDEYADLFRERCPKQIEIFGHHGSLGRDQREEVELGFRNARHALCIATMTLEIGIDIGDVDLVVCIDPPNNLSSFLQRIGRGCRRLQSATRVLCFSSNPISEVVFRAYEFSAKHGLPQTPLPPLRRSVLLQQILAYLEQTDRRRRTESQLLDVFCDPGRPAVLPEMVRAVAADMVATGLLTYEEGIYRIGKQGAEFISSAKIYSNLAPKTELAVIDADSGKTIAYVGSIDSERIRIAGKRYEVANRQVGGKLSVRGTDARGAVSPGYVAKGHFGFSSEVGACLAKYFGLSSSEIVYCESSYVFTWLGKLHNTVIANCFKTAGIQATPYSFCLKIGQRVEPHSLLIALRKASALVANGNGVGALSIDSIADCGAHHQALSNSARDRSRGDWIDGQFITNWADSIGQARLVSVADELFVQLMLLTQI